MSDLISRQAAIDALKNRWKKTRNYEGIGDDIAEECELYLKQVPSAQPGQRNARVFQGIIVEYPSISAYPEYEGKPYFSIKYTENGQEFIGYGTYKPEVLSEFLKEYFMPSAQPGWIPVTERLPEYGTTVLTCNHDGECAGNAAMPNLNALSITATNENGGLWTAVRRI